MLRMSESAESARVFESRSASATENLATRLAAASPAGCVVFLSGELGSGKSTFARAWLRALGVQGPIKSPTYTLLETYALGNGRSAVHIDLYRIAEPEEIDFLALESFTDPLAVLLVEWPEIGQDRLPAPDAWFRFAHGESVRRISLPHRSQRMRDALRQAGFPELEQ